MDLNDAEREREPIEDIDEVPPGIITADQVLAALRSVDVPHNEDRKNVKSDESALVRSLTLGALSRSHAPARVSAWARRRPRLARLLATYGCQQLPAGFPFASIQLNSDYASAMHCDRSNDGPSAIIALGDFEHGELWSYDRGVLPCKGEVKLFNGNQPHCTLPFKGERFSLIFFSSSGHDRMAPKEAMWLEALGFARLPTGTLSHSYRADEFASPHMEHPYTFGFHVTTEERCAYATKSLEAWREDWTPGVDDMAAACAARRKPGEVLGPDSVCPGLKLGYARLRSPTLRGDDRDGAGPSGQAECPRVVAGEDLRGPLVGVVMSLERSREAMIKQDGTVGDQLAIFQVFYQNGQAEEMELHEIARCLEPTADVREDDFSAPHLARRALRARGLGLDLGPLTSDPRYAVDASVVAARRARHATIRATFEAAEVAGDLVLPSAVAFVQSGQRFDVEDLVCALRLVTRTYGGAEDLKNLAIFCKAAGAADDASLKALASLPGEPQRAAALMLALDSRLHRLGFSEKMAAYAPTVDDLCLDREAMNDKFEEFGPPPRPTLGVKRLVLDLAAAAVSGDRLPKEAAQFRKECRDELEREKPPASYLDEIGGAVWVALNDVVAPDGAVAAAAEEHKAAGVVQNHRAHLVNARFQSGDDDDVALGATVRKSFLGHGVLEGVVAEKTATPALKYLVNWHSEKPEWYTPAQLRPLVVREVAAPQITGATAPAVVLPLSAAVAGDARLLYCLARRGPTAWHRVGAPRGAKDEADASALVPLRLLDASRPDGGAVVLARRDRLVAWEDGDAAAATVADATVAAAAAAAAAHAAAARKREEAAAPPPEEVVTTTSSGRRKRSVARASYAEDDDDFEEAAPREKKPRWMDASDLLLNDARIAVRQDNPKKAGSKSALRYDAYKAATTASEFLRLGGSKADLAHDCTKGFVTVLDDDDGAGKGPEDVDGEAPEDVDGKVEEN